MRITFDPNKRDAALAERGLDFADAAEVFASATVDLPDTRSPTRNHEPSPMAI